MLRRAGQTLSPAGSARIFRCVAERFPDIFPPAGRRAFSQSASRQNYDATIRNLLIHKDTKVLCQGLTGKTVRALSECLSFLYSPAIATGYFPCEGGARVRAWSVVSPPRRPGRPTSDFPFLAPFARYVSREQRYLPPLMRRRPSGMCSPMRPSSTCHHPPPRMLSSRRLRTRSV